MPTVRGSKIKATFGDGRWSTHEECQNLNCFELGVSGGDGM